LGKWHSCTPALLLFRSEECRSAGMLVKKKECRGAVVLFGKRSAEYRSAPREKEYRS